MRIWGREISVGVIATAAFLALPGCGGISSLDCNEIAERARTLSQTRPISFASIANARETSRSETEIRCTGDATLADGGTTPLYLRAHEENGNVAVAYQGMPFP